MFVREAQSQDASVSRNAVYGLCRHLEGLTVYQTAQFDILGNVEKLMDHQIALASKEWYSSLTISPLADILLDLVKNGNAETSARAFQQLEQCLNSDVLKVDSKLEILRAAGRVPQARSLVLSRLFHADLKISAKVLEIALDNTRDERGLQELFDIIQKCWGTLFQDERMALMDQLVANLGNYSSSA